MGELSGIFFPLNILYLRQVESVDVEVTDTEGEQYKSQENSVKEPPLSL